MMDGFMTIISFLGSDFSKDMFFSVVLIGDGNDCLISVFRMSSDYYNDIKRKVPDPKNCNIEDTVGFISKYLSSEDAPTESYIRLNITNREIEDITLNGMIDYLTDHDIFLSVLGVCLELRDDAEDSINNLKEKDGIMIH